VGRCTNCPGIRYFSELSGDHPVDQVNDVIEGDSIPVPLFFIKEGILQILLPGMNADTRYCEGLNIFA
jgi:hypothetical protein